MAVTGFARGVFSILNFKIPKPISFPSYGCHRAPVLNHTPVGKVKMPMFVIFRKGSEVFFDADSESPHVT